MEILNALEEFRKSTEALGRATKEIQSIGVTINQVTKDEIEERKKEAEELLKKIKV